MGGNWDKNFTTKSRGLNTRIVLVIHLGGTGGSIPSGRAGDSDSNPGPDENFSLKFNNIGLRLIL